MMLLFARGKERGREREREAPFMEHDYFFFSFTMSLQKQQRQHPQQQYNDNSNDNKETIQEMKQTMNEIVETTKQGRPSLLNRLSLIGQHIPVKNTTVQTPPLDCTMGMTSSSPFKLSVSRNFEIEEYHTSSHALFFEIDFESDTGRKSR